MVNKPLDVWCIITLVNEHLKILHILFRVLTDMSPCEHANTATADTQRHVILHKVCFGQISAFISSYNIVSTKSSFTNN